MGNILTKASNFYSGSGQPDFVRFSALKTLGLRHVSDDRGQTFAVNLIK